MKRLTVIGAGDLGQLIAHYATIEGQFELVGFFDDYRAPGERVGLGTILGRIEQIEQSYAQAQFDEILLGVGYKHFDFRKHIYEKLSGNVPFAKAINSSSYVAPTCQLGNGTVILPGCTLDRNVVVQANVFLNVGCVVAHDTTIGAHSFFGGLVGIAGASQVGECCFVGMGATVIDHVNVCRDAIIGAGAVVTRNITQPGTYIGCPARPLRAEDSAE